MRDYKSHLDGPVAKTIKKAHIIGLTFGFSQFVQYAVFAILFYSAALFIKYYPREGISDINQGQYIFIAIQSLVFGATQAG